MRFTFGIITVGNDLFVSRIIKDIQAMSIPEYEIIIVGGETSFDGARHIKFDESQKPMWVTRKKNIITENAKYENIVYLHDYVTFAPDWYRNFIDFGDDWQVCMNRIENFDGTRFRDWTLWPGNIEWENQRGFFDEFQPRTLTDKWILPYSEKRLSKLMYFSGAYWVAKKSVMQEFTLNETLSWGEGEDVDWSIRVRSKYDFTINERSIVRLLKQKGIVFQISDENEVMRYFDRVPLHLRS